MTRPKKKNPAAVQLGRLGGLKGGPARARSLTPERRREIARMGGQAANANKAARKPALDRSSDMP